MNPETLAEWYRLQGKSVKRTQSSYWCSLGPRVYQSFPFFWIIEPDEHEIRDFLWRESAVGLRYSAPVDHQEGVGSYHVICDAHDYDIKLLHRQTRQNISKGLSECTVEPIHFERLARQGYQLHLDSMGRQNCQAVFSKRAWERACHAAADLPGFEVWGALVNGELAAALMFVQVDDWIIFLSQESLTAHLQHRPNHALVYLLTKRLLSPGNIRAIFYTLESLNARHDVDEFKFRMGYKRIPVKQRAVFHPLVSPLVSRYMERTLCGLYNLTQSNGLISKAKGLVRLAVKEKPSYSG